MDSFSRILSLAYPLADLVEGGPKTTIQRFRSTTSLLHKIFSRCAFVSGIGVAICLFAVPLIDWALAEFETFDIFTELCSNLIHFLRGKWKRDTILPEHLPTELWGEIGKRIASRRDILLFRSVCKEWRSCLPCPTRFPLLVPPPPNCHPTFRNMPYIITEVTLYLCKGPKKMVVFEEVDQGSKFQGRYLRPWRSKCDFPMISFMDSSRHRRSKISFLCKAYQFRMGLPRSNSREEKVEGQWNLQESKFIRILALISSNAGHDGVNLSYARASDLSVVAHLSWGPMKGRLALLRLGGSPENMNWDTDFCSKVFRAVGTYKGQLCTLDYSGRVFLMDYNSLQMTRFGPPLPFDPPTSDPDCKFLFETSGDMFAVSYEKTRTMCYRLSLRHQKWLLVKYGPFIGYHCTKLVPYIA